MLTKEAQEQIIKEAFYSELEKLGVLAWLPRLMSLIGKKGLASGLKATNTGKFFAGASKHKGFQAKLNYFSRYASPTNMMKGKWGKVTQTDFKSLKMQTGKGNIPRGIRTSIGNTAQNIKELTKGLKGKNVWEGMSQAGKNIKDWGGNQLRGSLYKEVNVGNKGVDLGNKIFKRKGILPNSKILGVTNRGTALVRKKIPLNAAYTGPGMMVSTPLMISKDSKGNKLSVTKRVGQGAKDALLWGIAPPIGAADMLRSFTK